jgi:endonuclease III
VSKGKGKLVEHRRKRMEQVLPVLTRTYPDAHCRLDHSNPYQLLVATILSAQCTDDRVNIVTKDVFKKFPDAKRLAKAPQEELERDVQSTGFFRNKARSLRGMAAGLVERHGGEVPRDMESLVALPGVGRKTANVVLGNAFNMNEGVVVDTHVSRVSQRLGFTDHADPEKIEQDLIEVVPREDWTLFSHLLIFHGRAVCQARKPRCQECPLLSWCPAGQKLVKAALKGNGK